MNNSSRDHVGSQYESSAIDPYVDPAALRKELTHAQSAARWVGLIIPLILTGIATVLVLSWTPRMPDLIAIHWSGVGLPDRFGSPWMTVVLALGLGLMVTALYFLQALQGKRATGTMIWSSVHRLVPAVVLGTVTMLQTLAVGTAWMQLDLTDARDSQSVAPVMGIAFGLWIVVTVLAYLLQPKLKITPADTRSAAPIALEPGDRVMWIGAVQLPLAARIVMGVVILFLLTSTVALMAEAITFWWIPGTLTVIALLAFLLIATYRVRIDGNGVEARGLMKWPVYRIPVEQVEKVQVIEVSPFSEFGGWGLRSAPGRFGIVLRQGEGIEIHRRRHDRTFVLTVDDAENAARVLGALVQKSRN